MPFEWIFGHHCPSILSKEHNLAATVKLMQRSALVHPALTQRQFHNFGTRA